MLGLINWRLEMKPYRVEGCPFLLLKCAPWMDDVRINSLITIDSTVYKITHSFHDCIAIEEYYELESKDAV